MPEDKFIYCVGYSVEINGDVYSATPNADSNYGGTSIVQQVDLTANVVQSLSDTTTPVFSDFYAFETPTTDTEQI